MSRYQLIYAWGHTDEPGAAASTMLPAGNARARACQALLHVLAQPSGDIATTLHQEGVASWAGRPSGKSGTFPGPRLLPGAALDAALPQLCRQLAAAFVTQPPYAMRWMRNHPLQVCTVPLACSVVSLALQCCPHAPGGCLVWARIRSRRSHAAFVLTGVKLT